MCAPFWGLVFFWSWGLSSLVFFGGGGSTGDHGLFCRGYYDRTNNNNNNNTTKKSAVCLVRVSHVCEQCQSTATYRGGRATGFLWRPVSSPSLYAIRLCLALTFFFKISSSPRAKMQPPKCTEGKKRDILCRHDAGRAGATEKYVAMRATTSHTLALAATDSTH